MLYITTRGDRDAFTAHRTLCTDQAPDEGCFIPMRFPQFSSAEISLIAEQSFEETVAYILNIFFSANLTKWDVSLYVGRNTARVPETNKRIILAELWHNPGNCFQYVLDGLFSRVFGTETNLQPSEWFKVAVKIAILFGVYGELCHSEQLKVGDHIDLSLPADDFSYPIAALYATAIGLPLGSVICNCTKTHEMWNLIHRGTLNYSGVPDIMRAGVERFLSLRLNKVPNSQGSFEADAEEKLILRKGIFCVVSGAERVLHALNGVYSSIARIVTPDVALCFSGLGDYRAKTGESKLTLILEEDSPALYTEEIGKATGISKSKLENYLKE